ncbi:MAG: adenosylmethionine--8-amino-7-oxononanoate transaminase [Alphaproteobacteria bacterium]|nr:adenosylmethionine--8-amino-7-oxononanoate transaminase [Alphaproteobacteria bacterium]
MHPDSPSWQRDGLPHVWMPYTQHQTAPLPLPVKATNGCRIILEDGRELIDGLSSWWSACHGYNHPHILKALHDQLEKMPHVMFAGLHHEPALTLAKRLCRIAPAGLTRAFYSDSGSTAVEVALKMAAQYWRNKGDKQRTKFLCFRHGYHGDTMGGMSVSDPEGIHQAFGGAYAPMQFSVDLPTDEYGFAEFQNLLDGLHKQMAGVIIEPLVQAAGGFRFHSPDMLAEIHRLCKERGLLFIADEIATGFGRTGLMFACGEAGISPDILCLGKALTGGALPFAVTLATETIFEAFLGEKQEKSFMHGPTYMANPMGCAAALASLDLFEQEPRLAQVETIEQQLRTELAPIRRISGVRDVRVKGAIGVIEWENGMLDLPKLRQRFPECGVWLRPFGNWMYVMPPFTISESELRQLTAALMQTAKEMGA